jgi:hypothetical protein
MALARRTEDISKVVVDTPTTVNQQAIEVKDAKEVKAMNLSV